MSEPGEATPPSVRCGVVAVIDRNGAYLLIRRAEGIALGGAWCFPGGGIHAGELEAAALVREVREEVGLHVEAGRRLWTWQRDDGLLTLHFWSAVLIGGSLQPDPAEVQATAWLTPGEIRCLPGILPGNLEFLDRRPGDYQQ